MINRHNTIKELPQSYDFAPRSIDWFSIIVPEATRNLIVNPVIRFGTTGYAVTDPGIVLSRSDERQRRGPYSLKIVYGALGRAYYEVFISQEGVYTFSCDVFMNQVRDVAHIGYGSNLTILVDQLMTNYHTKSYAARGYWDRIAITFTADFTPATYTFSFMGDVGTIAYIDGLQLENKPYATTMCYGDLVGDAYPRKDYWWLGEPHNSYSERSAYCRTGGKEMNFFELGLRTLSIIGIGIAGLGNILIPTTRGSVYAGSVQQERSMTIVAERHFLQANVGMRERQTIERTMSPFITSPHQPLMLKYQYYDQCSNIDGEELWIRCLYESGLEGALDNYQERIGMAFRIYMPYVATGGSFGQELDPYNIETFTNPHTTSSGVLVRDADGNWDISGEFKGNASNTVYAIESFGNYVYVGGNFGSCNGVANTTQLARYDKLTGIWEAIPGFDALRPGGFVVHMKLSTDNKLYVGGRTGTSYWIVSIDLDDNLTLLASTPGATTFIKSFGVGKNNKLYCSGYDGSNYYVYEYDAGADSWSKVKTAASVDRGGFDSYIRDIVVGIDDRIYVTGDFAEDDTATYTYNGIVVSDDSAVSGWAMLGISGMSNSVGSSLGSKMLFSKSGDLYVIGSFDALDSIPYAIYIAKWNGYSWSALGNGIRGAYGVAGIDILDIVEDIYGSIYITGISMCAYELQNSTLLGYEVMKWDGSSWLPYEVDMESDTYPRPFSYGMRLDNEYVYLLFSTSQASLNIYSISDNGVIYPADTTDALVEITGPGTLVEIGNHTTREVIAFELEVNEDEVVVLRTGMTGIELISNTRGDITYEIFPGSSSTLTLANGTNRVYVLYVDTTSDSEVTLYCNKTFQSIAGAF